ncbi:MAG: CYTH domain-containing protein, partial [Burkholderiaceae bacterium]
METEIKLLLAPDAVATLRRHPLLNPESGPPPLTRRLDSVYFDTADLRLRRHEMSLRVRDAGDARTQTLKSAGDGGPWQCGEWETPVDGERPDLARLGAAVDDPRVARLLKKQAAGELASLFAVRIERTVWTLEPQPGARVEVALDLGEIVCGASRQAVREVELELKAGDPVVLFDLALALLDTVPMRLGNASKSERGVALCCTAAASALSRTRRAGMPDRTMTAGRAFRRIAGACLGQMLDHVDGVIDRGDAASLHRLRVGLRRLRAALRLFRDIAPCPAPLQDDLRWLHDVLGEARDAGVLAGTTLPSVVARFPERGDLPALQHAAAARAAEAITAAGAALASARATRCFLGIGGWLAERGGRAVPGTETPVAEFAARALRRLARRLRRGGIAC